MASPPEARRGGRHRTSTRPRGARTLRTGTPAQAPGLARLSLSFSRPAGASARGARPRRRREGRARPDAISRRPGRPLCSGKRGNRARVAWGAGSARVRRSAGCQAPPPHSRRLRPGRHRPCTCWAAAPALRQPGLIPSARSGGAAQAAPGRLARSAGPQDRQARQPRARASPRPLQRPGHPK